MDADLESELHALGFTQNNLTRGTWVNSAHPLALVVKSKDGTYKLSISTGPGVLEWARTYGFPTPLAAAVAYKLLKPSLL